MDLSELVDEIGLGDGCRIVVGDYYEGTEVYSGILKYCPSAYMRSEVVRYNYWKDVLFVTIVL